MKHIMIVCMHFHPIQFRVNDIAEELVKRGYKVTAVTGIPNYPDAHFTPGYGWFKRRKETYQGIDIIRIPIFPRGKSSFSLMLNYFSFNFFGFFFSLFTRIKADHVFIYGTSPLLKARVGLRYAKRRKIESTLYVMDLWPESVQYAGGIHQPVILKYLRKKMQKIYALSTHILTSSESFIDSIHALGVPKEKITYWPQSAENIFNGSMIDDIQTEMIKDERLNFIFAGTIAVAQGLDILPHVAVLLKQQSYKVRFVLIGDGRAKDELKSLINQLDINDYFQLIDRKPVHEIPAYFKSADCALLTLKESPIFSKTIPAKLQSYMTFGIPIIASASGEVERIINEAHCGFASKSEDVEGLFQNIVTFLSTSLDERKHMAKHAKTYAEIHFDRQKLMNQLESIMNLKENEHHV